MDNIKGIKKATVSNKDVFNNGAPFNKDHIWPISKGGANAQINLMKLSKETNDEKKDKTSGNINEKRFAVEKALTKKDKNGQQLVYGRLYVEDDDGWYEVKE